VSHTLWRMEVFPAFALPIMRTRNLISLGIRGRFCCESILQDVVTRLTRGLSASEIVGDCGVRPTLCAGAYVLLWMASILELVVQTWYDTDTR
jgi:hypothetical protein